MAIGEAEARAPVHSRTRTGSVIPSSCTKNDMKGIQACTPRTERNWASQALARLSFQSRMSAIHPICIANGATGGGQQLLAHHCEAEEVCRCLSQEAAFSPNHLNSMRTGEPVTVRAFAIPYHVPEPQASTLPDIERKRPPSGSEPT
jgi:DNA-binding transcriptional regulator YiaG